MMMGRSKEAMQRKTVRRSAREGGGTEAGNETPWNCEHLSSLEDEETGDGVDGRSVADDAIALCDQEDNVNFFLRLSF